jgi:hypothetical protein
MPKINRVTANFGGDEVMAAAREHLRLGEIVDEAGGAETGQAQAGALEGACA